MFVLKIYLILKLENANVFLFLIVVLPKIISIIIVSDGPVDPKKVYQYHFKTKVQTINFEDMQYHINEIIEELKSFKIYCIKQLRPSI